MAENGIINLYRDSLDMYITLLINHYTSKVMLFKENSMDEDIRLIVDYLIKISVEKIKKQTGLYDIRDYVKGTNGTVIIQHVNDENVYDIIANKVSTDDKEDIAKHLTSLIDQEIKRYIPYILKSHRRDLSNYIHPRSRNARQLAPTNHNTLHHPASAFAAAQDNVVAPQVTGGSLRRKSRKIRKHKRKNKSRSS